MGACSSSSITRWLSCLADYSRFNYLFSGKVVPLLANRGANLTKDDLENKRKVDQELFTTVILEYNEPRGQTRGSHRAQQTRCASLNPKGLTCRF